MHGNWHDTILILLPAGRFDYVGHDQTRPVILSGYRDTAFPEVGN